MALVGCAPSPLVQTPAGAQPLDSSTSQREAAATEEQYLGRLNTMIAQQADTWAIPSATAAWCRSAADAHANHLTTLCRAEPLAGVNADDTPVIHLAAPDAIAPDSGQAALSALAERYLAAAEECRKTLMSCPAGSSAMFWASLYCFNQMGAKNVAEASDKPLVAPQRGQAVPTAIDVGSYPDRLASLLSQLDALRFGLETMIGRSGNSRADMQQRRSAVDNVRNQVAAQLTAVSATPAGPAIEYTMPGDINDSSAWNHIWGTLESAVLAGWVAVAAASAADSEQRQAALTGIADQCTQPGQHDIGLDWWPGWV